MDNKEVNSFRCYTRSLIVMGAMLAYGFAPATVQAQICPSKLYVVSVGVSNYLYMKDLRSANKDADDVARFFKTQEGKLFHSVDSIVLKDSQASTTNIRQALLWARRNARFDTYVLIYFAGHGSLNFAEEYYFCTHEFADHQKFETSVSWSQMSAVLKGLPGRTIIILDSCHSGAVTNLQKDDNLIVFCSSLEHQISGETSYNGYFTESLIQAMSGKADFNRNNIVTLSEIDAYVSGNVQAKTKGGQETVLIRSPGIPSTMPMASLVFGVFTPPSLQLQLNLKSSGPLPEAESSPQIQSSGPLTLPAMTVPEGGSSTEPLHQQQAFQSSGPLMRNGALVCPD